jgi:hypothetical protein
MGKRRRRTIVIRGDCGGNGDDDRVGDKEEVAIVGTCP